MKRNISIISLLTFLSVSIFSVYAKIVVDEGDWGDDNPGGVVVNFINPPKASFENLCLVLTSDSKIATIKWTLEEGLLPEAEEGWNTYSSPIALTEDCKVSYYATTRQGVCSEVKSYEFIYADHQTKLPLIQPLEEGKLLTMSCSTPGAEIRYTLDGSEPDKNSLLFTEAIPVTSYLYKVRAFASGSFPSDVAEYAPTSLSISSEVPSALFEKKSLSLTCSDSEAEILYTMNPDATPEDVSQWSVYSSPLKLEGDCCVRFYSRKKGCNDSDIQSFAFVLANYRAATPTIERNEAGTHIVMESATEGGIIRYTMDGTVPTENSEIYSEPVMIEGNFTYTAATFSDELFESESNRYEVKNMAVPDPFASFGRKLFYLFCRDPKAEIRYTTDPDADPENLSAWNVYTEPFELHENVSLRFFSCRENFNNSDIEQLFVKYADYQTPAPSICRNQNGTHIVMTFTPIDPSSGYLPDDDSELEFSGPQIRYTTDGSEPVATSPIYQSPVRIVAGAIYRARVFDPNYYDSEITEYAIGNSSLPVPEAEFKNSTLILSCSDKEAGIWYTLDPDAAVDELDKWSLYEAPLQLNEDCTYRFYAGDDDQNASDVQSFVFQRADYTVAAPTIERSEDGNYVEMESATPKADIRYTVDGSDPTRDSYLYSEPIIIPNNITFKARAFVTGLYDSAVTEFVVNNMATPVAYATVENKTLVLTCADSEAAIWFSTNPNPNPDDIDAWKLYEGPIELTEDATFHFLTRRDKFNDSDIETFVFIKAEYQVAAPLIERNETGTSLVMTCETEGAEIRYTTDGSEPTSSSDLYTDPVMPDGNVTFKVKAFADGLFESAITEYTISNMTVIGPSASFENLKLNIISGDENAEIFYSIIPAGSAGGQEEWNLYDAPLALDNDCDVRFFARRQNYNDSDISTFSFVYSDYQAEEPVVTLSDDETYFIISSAEDGEIRYTLDGSDPDENSILYTEPIKLADGTNTIKARVFVDNLFPSEIAELTYDSNPTGIYEATVKSGLVFGHCDGNAGFYSEETGMLTIYDLKGAVVAVMQLESGFNKLPDLPRGVYVAAGTKFKI